MRKNSIKISGFILLLGILSACEKFLELDLTGWNTYTHGAGPANYTELFDNDKVHRIDLETSSKEWNRLIKETTRSYGKFGGGGNIGGYDFGDEMQDTTNMADTTDTDFGEFDEGGGEELIGEADLPYIPFSLYLNGTKWFKVGVKFKGNSTMEDGWNQGSLKLPLRMLFDKFNDVYQGIDNQRFYGFRLMTFASNALDPVQIREKLAYELMGNFGIPVPKTNFAEIYIDHGSGLTYHGLYTMIEVIEDAMIIRCFNGTIGNCYKPYGPSATLQKGKLNGTDLNRKTNKWSNDYSDVANFVDILHDENRTSNPEAWHTKLEEVFDVDGFLKWLAANTVIHNWDAYGISDQNYYLYHNPQNDKIVFIPWDVSESFDGRDMSEVHAIDQSNISNEFPLIRFLIDDTYYYKIYKNHVKDFNENIFVPSAVNSRIDELFNLVQDKILNEKEGYTIINDKTTIQSNLQELKSMINQRHEEVKLFYQ